MKYEQKNYTYLTTQYSHSALPGANLCAYRKELKENLNRNNDNNHSVGDVDIGINEVASLFDTLLSES